MSLVRGDALSLPLADGSVDLIVTSPPYFALRSYTDGGEHYPGQIGSEPTPQEFLDALWAATAEMVRVLKPSGSIWVNLGDSYSRGDRTTRAPGPKSDRVPLRSPRFDVPGKSLCGLPWRYAIGCIDRLELILRAEVIWSKPNGLPESVTDRVRRSHEQWFMFTKEPRYFSAVDEIREPHADVTLQRAQPHLTPPGRSWRDGSLDGQPPHSFDLDHMAHPLGKLPGSVWTVPSEPLRVPDGLPQHFAAFPSEFPRRIILGWSPSGVCEACGEGRRPVRRERAERGDNNPYSRDRSRARSAVDVKYLDADPIRIVGYSCACPTPDAPTRPAVVLDPFCGTGTVPAAANALGRHGIGVDLSADYLRLARWRCADPGLRAKALGVDKPKAELPGQLRLLEGVA